jgi:hypothetical protein
MLGAIAALEHVAAVDRTFIDVVDALASTTEKMQADLWPGRGQRVVLVLTIW